MRAHLCDLRQCKARRLQLTSSPLLRSLYVQQPHHLWPKVLEPWLLLLSGTCWMAMLLAMQQFNSPGETSQRCLAGQHLHLQLPLTGSAPAAVAAAAQAVSDRPRCL